VARLCKPARVGRCDGGSQLYELGAVASGGRRGVLGRLEEGGHPKRWRMGVYARGGSSGRDGARVRAGSVHTCSGAVAREGQVKEEGWT